MYRVLHTKKYPTWAGIVLALMLLGGILASQTWCWQLSKRLWHPYRRAYGTKRKMQHIDSYTPEHSSNGTGSSRGTESSGNGASPFHVAKEKLEDASVGPSFPLTDQGLSTSLPKEGKKGL